MSPKTDKMVMSNVHSEVMNNNTIAPPHNYSSITYHNFPTKGLERDLRTSLKNGLPTATGANDSLEQKRIEKYLRVHGDTHFDYYSFESIQFS
jgi:hypothetical protein